MYASNEFSERYWQWIIVGCAFMMNFMNRAMEKTLPVFHVEFLHTFQASESQTAWVLSIHNCLNNITGMFKHIIL